MSDFTIEQLEALKEGTTPGPWITHAGSFGRIESVGPIEPGFSGNGLECTEEDAALATAAPDLVDALIAEKRAHQGLRSYLNDLRGAYGEEFDPNDEWEKGLEYAYREVARELAHILEGE